MRTLLVDGNQFLQRVLHTDLVSAVNSRGVKIGGILGMLQTLRTSMVKFWDAYRVFVVWDGERSRRRRDLYPEYKENRKPKSDEEKAESDAARKLFVDQRHRLQRLLPTFGIENVTLPSREGDDTLYHLAQTIIGIELPSEPHLVIISEDKDLYQLVSARVSVYRPRSDEHVTLQSLGISPGLLVFEKALMGDVSDGIPGVPGIGPVLARRLTNQAAESFGESEHPALLALDQLTGLVAAVVSTDTRNRKKYATILEHRDLVRRNVSLLDLSEEVLCEHEEDFLKSCVIRESCSFDGDGTRRLAALLELDKRIENWGPFVEPFSRLERSVS